MSDASSNSRPGSGHDGPSRWAAVRVTLLVLGCLLVAGATFAALLTDDPRWLKGAVLAAGWACALALIAGARPRSESEWSHARVRELRRSYELEVEREVAARREYELQLEVQVRRELDAETAAKLTALRTEISALRAELNARHDPGISMRRVEVRAETVHADATDTVVGMAPVPVRAARPVRREADLLAQHGGASRERQGLRRQGAPAGTAAQSRAGAVEDVLAEALEPFGLSDTGTYRGGSGFAAARDPGAEQLPLFDRESRPGPRRPDPPPDAIGHSVPREPQARSSAYRPEPEIESTSGRHAVPDPTGPPSRPASGSRRRRRYREDDEENEVINRVLRER